MLYSIPSTQTLRDYIERYAKNYHEWRSFMNVSQDCDLQIYLFDFEDEKCFRIDLVAYKEASIQGYISSWKYSKKKYSFKMALTFPQNWTFYKF